MARQEREKQIRNNTLDTHRGNTRKETGMRIGTYGGMQTPSQMSRWDFEPTRRGDDKPKEYY